MKVIPLLALLLFSGFALEAPNANANPALDRPEWVAGLKESDYSRLLAQVKVLRKNGARAYSQTEAQPFAKALGPLAPKLIVVGRDSIEFFLNSDLDKPQILRFWRQVGVWAPNAVLWVADLKAPGQGYESRLWEVKEMMSDAEVKAEGEIGSREEALRQGYK